MILFGFFAVSVAAPSFLDRSFLAGILDGFRIPLGTYQSVCLCVGVLGCQRCVRQHQVDRLQNMAHIRIHTITVSGGRPSTQHKQQQKRRVSQLARARAGRREEFWST